MIQVERKVINGRPSKLIESEKDEIVILFNEGMTQKEIANRYGVSLSTVQSVLRNRRYKENNYYVTPDEVKDTMSRKRLNQVLTTMRIEDMSPSREIIEMLIKEANKEITTEDILKELYKKYAE